MYGTEWIAFMNSGWFWILLVWSGVWKGISLWKSARNKHLVWFVVLFVFNTAGILPIIYLLIHSRKNKAIHHPANRTIRKTGRKTRRRKK